MQLTSDRNNVFSTQISQELLILPSHLAAVWTRVRIQTETYGFARQKTHSGSRNLILIFWVSFLVDFRPKMAF